MEPFVDIVLREGDPSTRYKLALAGRGGDGAARRASIRRSERVAAQLSERGHDDCIAQHPYTRWTGAHWVLATPRRPRLQPGDMALLPPARPGSGVVARRTSAARGGRRVPGTDSDDRRPCADPRVPRGERALRILGTGVGRPTRRNGLLRQLLTAQHGPCAGDDRTKHPSKRRCGRFPARRCCQGSALVRIQFAVDHTPFRKEGGPKPLQPCRPWVERRQHTASEEP